jgi:hypothetical protein
MPRNAMLRASLAMLMMMGMVVDCVGEACDLGA